MQGTSGTTGMMITFRTDVTKVTLGIIVNKATNETLVITDIGDTKVKKVTLGTTVI